MRLSFSPRSARSLLAGALGAFLLALGAHAADAPAAATANAARFDKLGHRMMCACGCNQLLGECNHLGCPDSPKMRDELAASISRGDDDDTIYHAFEGEYGATVLAAPMFTGLNRFSWFVPPLVLLLGIGGVVLLVRRWRPQVASMPARSPDPRVDARNRALEQRVRREIESDPL
jgi:cytochrome c-type biogenesis protein CcmH/NrfF